MSNPNATPNATPAPDSLPRKVIVSLRAGGLVFALANVICVAILAYAWLSVKLEPKTINVTGSARKAIASDRITWTGTLTARNADLVAAYDQIKSEADKTRAYLNAHGIPDSDITFAAINTTKFYKQVFGPNNQTMTTTDIDLYQLTQTVSIDSTDMQRVPAVARSVTDLIKDGVQIESGSTNYLYTKLSELKIDMLGAATKDATTRAEQIVTNANGRLGKLVEARMGVMQINAKGENYTSAEGINDTTSYEKEITAVVSARFEVR